jgi:hypothetical protein
MTAYYSRDELMPLFLEFAGKYHAQFRIDQENVKAVVAAIGPDGEITRTKKETVTNTAAIPPEAVDFVIHIGMHVLGHLAFHALAFGAKMGWRIFWDRPAKEIAKDVGLPEYSDPKQQTIVEDAVGLLKQKTEEELKKQLEKK